VNDEAQNPARQPIEPRPAPAGTSRIRPRLLLLSLAAVLTVVAGAAVLILRNPPPPEQPSPAPPFDARLVVTITSADRSKNEVQVDEPRGALPVRAGERMRLMIEVTEPAYCYCLWIDGRGNLAPLYPWNNDGAVEIKDANTPLPGRRPTRVLFSPAYIGSGWAFDRHGGLETVLFLARRTPPEQELRLGDLLAGMPPARMREPNELAVLRFDRDQSAAATILARDRGSEADAREIDRPLIERMAKLRDTFELVRAVRFTHESE
jgi:hypothetical protein